MEKELLEDNIAEFSNNKKSYQLFKFMKEKCKCNKF